MFVFCKCTVLTLPARESHCMDPSYCHICEDDTPSRRVSTEEAWFTESFESGCQPCERQLPGMLEVEEPPCPVIPRVKYMARPADDAKTLMSRFQWGQTKWMTKQDVGTRQYGASERFKFSQHSVKAVEREVYAKHQCLHSSLVCCIMIKTSQASRRCSSAYT